MDVQSLMSRHFVQVNGRQVHYRRWGEGPAVLALHGSPQSSRTMAGPAEAFTRAGLCVIAPDTPGNGLSEPLAKALPDASDYAVALAAFADALGLQRVGLYGFHTGAGIACAFSSLYPQRTVGAVFEGLADWSEQERQACLNGYLPPFRPEWDGSHMTWLWTRMEDQTLFFPWQDRTQSARLSLDVSSPDHIHANAMDMLDAGDNYRAVYRGAFTFRPQDYVPDLPSPYMIAAAHDDVLSAHLSHPVFSQAPVFGFDTRELLHEAGAALLVSAAAGRAPPPGESGADAQGLSRGFVEGLAWRGRLDGVGRPLVLLHAAGDDLHTFDPLLSALAARRPTVALDLPGHGASQDDRDERSPSRAVLQALAALGLKDPAVVGVGFGGQVAAALGVEGSAAHVGAITPCLYSPAQAQALRAEGAPSLAPEWDGAHLVRAFRIARWERLFRPWFSRDQAHALPAIGSLEADQVHQRAVSLLRSANVLGATLDAQSRFDWLEASAALGSRLRTYAVESEPAPDDRLQPHAATELLAGSLARWAAPLGRFAR